MRRSGRKLDEILLVGGATRTPSVRRFVANMTVRPAPPAPLSPFDSARMGGHPYPLRPPICGEHD
eukprot:191945-Pyramimonas_sp.AAC.2